MAGERELLLRVAARMRNVANWPVRPGRQEFVPVRLSTADVRDIRAAVCDFCAEELPITPDGWHSRVDPEGIEGVARMKCVAR